MTIVLPAFCLFLYLTGVHFRGKLQHGGDVSQQKIKCRPIRTRETGGASLSDVLYVVYSKILFLDILEKQEIASCALYERQKRYGFLKMLPVITHCTKNEVFH